MLLIGLKSYIYLPTVNSNISISLTASLKVTWYKDEDNKKTVHTLEMFTYICFLSLFDSVCSEMMQRNHQFRFGLQAVFSVNIKTFAHTYTLFFVFVLVYLTHRAYNGRQKNCFGTFLVLFLSSCVVATSFAVIRPL